MGLLINLAIGAVGGNLAWGDDDAMTIYATGPSMVTRVRVNVEGLRP